VNVPADVGSSYRDEDRDPPLLLSDVHGEPATRAPVKFEEDRLENLQGGDMHSPRIRGYQMRMAVDNDGTMRGLDVWFVDDFGAYPRYPINQVLKPLSVLTNSLRDRRRHLRVRPRIDQQDISDRLPRVRCRSPIYALEMIVDERLERSIWTRRVPPPEPDPASRCRTRFLKNLYDSGDYPATLDRIGEIIADERDGGLLDPGRRRETRGREVPRRPAERHYRTRRQRPPTGPIASRPTRTTSRRFRATRSRNYPSTSRAEIRGDGSVHAFLATDSSDRATLVSTLVSQLLADELEVLPSDIEVGYLDSVDAPTEYGSAASRMAVMLSGATVGVAERLLANVEELAADHWGVSTDDVTYHDRTVDRLGGNDSLSLAEIAELDAETNAADERRTQ